MRFKKIATYSRPMIFVTIFIFTIILNSASFVAASPNTQTGIWYSTWYTNEGKYIWEDGHGSGSKSQLLGDVNCDGKDDAVAFFDTNSNGFRGAWYVAKSNTSGDDFENGTKWPIAGSPNQDGHGSGSKKQFLADVNGDGCDDAIVFFDVAGYLGNWYVALSNGTNGFGNPGTWITSYGSGSKNQFMADVTGDGKADAVAFFDSNSNGFRGSWYMAKSNFPTTNKFVSPSKLFIANSPYGDGHGSGSKNQFMADVTGDGKADAVIFMDTTGYLGRWDVAVTNSSASGLNSPSTWLTGQGSGSQKQFLKDRTGDGKADAIYYFNNQDIGAGIPNGSWYAANSNYPTTNQFSSPQLWKYEHGNSSFLSSTNQLVGNVNGSANDSADPVVFNEPSGDWRVLPSEEFIEPPRLNLWEAWNVEYRPMVNGVPSIYDSGDAAVIDEHLEMIEAAGIDYLLFDMTNRFTTGYIFERAKAVCSRIANHNASGGNLKFAVAVGEVQWTHNPATVETEASYIKNEFVNDPVCGSSYYQYQNKPLMIAYGNETDIYGANGWSNYTSKTHTNDFTVIPALAKLPNATANSVSWKSEDGTGCGTMPTSTYYGNTLGWGLPYGTPTNGPIMSVMPGWRNKNNERILRTQNSVPDGFYKSCGWDRILTATPDMVVINSFNEFPERTAVMPTQTSGVSIVEDRWPSSNYFWDITLDKLSQL